VLSGVLRRNVKRQIRLIAKTLGVTFVDPNSWLEDWDFARDGLHINQRRARRLSQLYSRFGGLGGRGKKVD
jgi:hypothetical protein